MRKRFEQQFSIGTLPIHEVKIRLKSRDCIPSFLASLQVLYTTPEYNEKIFSILEARLVKGRRMTGRPGMDLWQIFVLAQLRYIFTDRPFAVLIARINQPVGSPAYRQVDLTSAITHSDATLQILSSLPKFCYHFKELYYLSIPW